MRIKRSILGVRPFILSLFLVLTLATNVSATQVSDKSESVEIVEDKEDKLMGTTKPSSFSRAALSILAEGVYDTIKDTKNSAGVMIERRFYKSGKLTEKRTYTSTGSTDCRMRNKYLYYSDGATLERHRTYLNTGTTCYNTNTKRYGTNKKLEWQLIYDGSKGYAKEGRYYDITAAYYTRIDYYTAGKKTIKHYWLWATGNRVTHVANLNSAGTEWLKATYYYDYTNKKVKQIINYTGKTPNLRTNETYYGTTGIKEWYRTYDSAGDQYHLTYYQANGVKKQEARYLKGTGVWTWDIKYQTNGIDRESVRYRNEDNIYTRQLYYYAAGSKLKYDILYDDEGIKTSAKVYDEATGKLKQDEWYVDGKIDVVEYYNLEGETTRKARYFKDGTHLRWDINYVDGKKESVKVLDFISYQTQKNIEYTDIYLSNESLFNSEYKNTTISELTEDVVINKQLSSILHLEESTPIYYEDLLCVSELTLIGDNQLDAEDIDAEKIEFRFLNYFTEVEKMKLKNIGIVEIPSSISMMKNLEVLDVSNNNIDTVDTELNKLENIKIINLADNKISDISECFDKMYNLETLNLQNNKIENISSSLYELKENGKLQNIVVNQKDLNVLTADSLNYAKVQNNSLFVNSFGEKINKFTTINEEKQIRLNDENNLIEQSLSEFAKGYIYYTDTESKDTKKSIIVSNIDTNQEIFSDVNFTLKDITELKNILNNTEVNSNIKIVLIIESDTYYSEVNVVKYTSQTLEEENASLGIANTSEEESNFDDNISSIVKEYKIESVEYYNNSKMVIDNSVQSNTIDGGYLQSFNFEGNKDIRNVKTNIEIDSNWIINKRSDGIYVYNSLDSFLFLIPNIKVETDKYSKEGKFIIKDNVIYAYFEEKEHESNTAVVAFSTCTDVINDGKTKWHKRSGWTIMVKPTKCARNSGVEGPSKRNYNTFYYVRDRLYPQLTSWATSKKRTTSERKRFKNQKGGLKDQLLCHYFSIPRKSTYNIEPWRSDVSYRDTALALCNPK